MDRWEGVDDGINHSTGRVARLGMGGFVKGAEVAAPGPRGVEVVKSRKDQRQQERNRQQPTQPAPAPVSQAQCPAWASAPPHAATMVVSKGGKEIDVLQLHKACTTFGRLPDNDVVADHGSLSRHHCHVSFDGALAAYMLTDLASAHGTRLNGARLAPHVPTQLAHNDDILLGASSRVYQLRLSQAGERPRKRARVTFPEDHKLSQVLGYSDGGAFCRVGPQRAAPHEVGRFANLLPARTLPASSQPATAPGASTAPESAPAEGADDADGASVDCRAADGEDTDSQLGQLREAQDLPGTVFDTAKLKIRRRGSPAPCERELEASRMAAAGAQATCCGRAAGGAGDHAASVPMQAPEAGASGSSGSNPTHSSSQDACTDSVSDAREPADAVGLVPPDAVRDAQRTRGLGSSHRGASGAASCDTRDVESGEAGAVPQAQAAGGAGAHSLAYRQPAGLVPVHRHGGPQQHLQAAPGVLSNRSSAAGQGSSADDTLLNTFFSELGELNE